MSPGLPPSNVARSDSEHPVRVTHLPEVNSAVYATKTNMSWLPQLLAVCRGRVGVDIPEMFDSAGDDVLCVTRWHRECGSASRRRVRLSISLERCECSLYTVGLHEASRQLACRAVGHAASRAVPAKERTLLSGHAFRVDRRRGGLA